MTLVPMLVSTLLCGMVFSANAASLQRLCKIPTDLSAVYNGLLTATIGNKFLQLQMNMPTIVNHSFKSTDKTCPDTLPSNGDINDRSRCPWYNKLIRNNTMFPSEWSEAICRCSDCIGHQGIDNCEMVYTDIVFLMRMPGCVDGFFVYEQTIKKVATSCICARRKMYAIKPSKLTATDI